MKKNVLLLCLIAVSSFAAAQKVWNFSLDPFGANAMTGGSAAINYTITNVIDGLTLGTDGTALFNITANAKTIDGTAYTHRLQTGGGGAPVAPSKIPTTRYLSFNVSGASTIKIGMISSNSSQSRTLIVVNENQTVLDSIVNIGGASALTYTYEYPGPAAKLYLYSRSSGINYYYLSVTNFVLAGVNTTYADKGITYNGVLIKNSKHLNLEIYDVIGKKIATTNKDFSMESFPKGVYVIKAEGIEKSMKICRE